MCCTVFISIVQVLQNSLNGRTGQHPLHILKLQSRHDVHALQLLYQQLARVRDLNLPQVLPRPAVLAPRGMAQQAALFADVDLERIGRSHQPLVEQHGRAIANQAVTLHLAETQAAIP